MRYLVVDTANWLSARQVLITPETLGQPDWESQIFPVDLNKKQVREGPPVEADQPVSRSPERELHHYFGWRSYWSVAATPVRVQTMNGPRMTPSISGWTPICVARKKSSVITFKC